MTDIDQKILDDFWSMHSASYPNHSKSDFEVTWREGYAFYYDVRLIESGMRVLSVHADVVDSSTDRSVIANEIAKATKQIRDGDAELVHNVDAPVSNVPSRHVNDWLKDYE